MRPKNPNANKSVTVVNEHELAQLFAMPAAGRTDEALLCAAKMAPSNKSFKKGEKWSMMDSATGCRAAKQMKDLGKRSDEERKESHALRVGRR